MPLALKPHARSIERAFSILEMLNGTRRGWNISEISRKQRIPKSSAHVIVLELERMGYLKRENRTRRYKLGLKICSLGRGLMNDLALPEIALPHMRWLVEQTRLTAHLGVLEKGHIVVTQKIDGPGMVNSTTTSASAPKSIVLDLAKHSWPSATSKSFTSAFRWDRLQGTPRRPLLLR